MADLNETQSVFRGGRFCQANVFYVRQIKDKSKKSGLEIYMIVLDFEKVYKNAPSCR